MKEFIFVSDFDGTLTKDDFYKILINKYNPGLGQELENEWVNGNITVFDFLQRIFNSINISENQLLDDILTIEFDNYFKDFVEQIKESGGDILVLSAGSTYYIERLFSAKGINNIDIISNPGFYKDGALILSPDIDSPFYSIESGVNKAHVVEDLTTKYKNIYYAGDGSPDFKASKKANIVFAKDVLKKMCEKNNVKYVPFENFKDISIYLKSIGVLKNEA